MSERRHAIIAAVILLALPLLYVLSYAPAYRFILGSDAKRVRTPAMFSRPSLGSIYTPVEWAIDHTPLEAPLLKWGRVWGVEEQLKWGSAARQFSGLPFTPSH